MARSRTPPAGLLALAIALFGPAGALADTDLEVRIAMAERLNVTASWQESQAYLDALAPALDAASADQRARVTFLRARNQALAGAYDAAEDLAASIHDAEVTAETRLKALRLSANIELQRDRFEAAYGYLRQALALLPEVDAVDPRTNLLALAANFFSQAGDTDKAIAYGRQALEIARAADRPRALCIGTHDLAAAFEDAGRLTEALPLRRQALAACEAAGDPVHVGVSKVSLGHLLDHLPDQRRPGTAPIDLIDAGLRELAIAGYHDGVQLAKVRLAQALARAGDGAGAEAILRPMLDELAERGYWRNLQRAHALLADLTAARGDYRASIGHLKAAEEADDRLLDRERAIRVAYLQADFDIRSKEQQIALLEERNAVLRLEEETMRQRRLLAIGGAAALAIIVLLLLGLLARTLASRRRLLWLSRHDGLTGLLNHTTFFARARDALAVATRDRRSFTLVVGDIDLFKAINDLYGHAAGDAVLREVGRLLRATFESSGLIGRVGGEEFAIALPRLDGAAACDGVRSFQEALERSGRSDERPTVTLSFGLAEAEPGESLERLRERADGALYEAKRLGRNRIVDAGELETDLGRTARA